MQIGLQGADIIGIYSTMEATLLFECPECHADVVEKPSMTTGTNMYPAHKCNQCGCIWMEYLNSGGLTNLIMQNGASLNGTIF
jgi:hypothetical protein